MGAGRFCRYQLLTVDVPAARAFYTDVLGAALWAPDITVAPLPERAAQRGAPPHWRGHIATNDVDETLRKILTLGGEQLGQTQHGEGGDCNAALRDPFGSVIALCSVVPDARRSPVGWYVLHTRDDASALAFYAAQFGWCTTEVLDLGPEVGHQRLFAFEASGPSVGAVADTARLPHVHPHWLFCFRVPDIENALARVRGHRATGFAPTPNAQGDLIAACEDPQGAAFALYQCGEEPAASP